MKYYIIDPDFKKYVYVCDIEHTHLVFAIPREKEFIKFKNYHCEYTFDKLEFMPKANVVKVLRLHETANNIYRLIDNTLLEYPASKIYIIYPTHISNL